MNARPAEPLIATALRQLGIVEHELLQAKLEEFRAQMRDGADAAQNFGEMLLAEGIIDEAQLLRAQRATISGAVTAVAAHAIEADAIDYDPDAEADAGVAEAERTIPSSRMRHDPRSGTATVTMPPDADGSGDADSDDVAMPTIQGSHRTASVRPPTGTDADADDEAMPTIESRRTGAIADSANRQRSGGKPGPKKPGPASRSARTGGGSQRSSGPIPTEQAEPDKSIVGQMGFGRLVELEAAPRGQFERFGRYSITGRLGRGGMGDVLSVRDPDLNRDIALKVMLKGSDAERKQVEKFLVEAQVTGQLEHPNIPPLHELGLSDGQPYFTMKYVRGRSLKDIIAEMRRRAKGEAGKDSEMPDYSVADLLDMFSKICDGVAFAHAKGVVHRDLKPENVMVGEFGEVLVMDWGLAKVRGIEDKFADAVRVNLADSGVASRMRGTESGEDIVKTMDGTILGTPMYMPPEQAHGDIAGIDTRSDIYSLGAILYEILTLHRPIDGNTAMEILVKVAAGEIVPPNQRTAFRRISPELEAVVLKAMARHRDHRYPTVQDLQKDIRAFLAGHTLSAVDYSMFGRLLKFIKRNRVLVGAASAVVVVAIAVALVMQQIKAAEEAFELERKRQQIDGYIATANTRMTEAERLRGETDFESALRELGEARTAYNQIIAIDTEHDAGLRGRIETATLQAAIEAEQKAAADRRQQELLDAQRRQQAEELEAEKRRETERRVASARVKMGEAQTAMAAAMAQIADADDQTIAALNAGVFELFVGARDELARAPLASPEKDELTVELANEHVRAQQMWEQELRVLAQRTAAVRSLAVAEEFLAKGRDAHTETVAMRERIDDADDDRMAVEWRREIDVMRGTGLANLLDALNAYNEAVVIFAQLTAHGDGAQRAARGRLQTLLLLTEQAMFNQEFQMAEFWMQKAEEVAPTVATNVQADARADVRNMRDELNHRRSMAEGYQSAFAAGSREYQIGNFTEAVAHFQRAKQLLDTPEVRVEIDRARFYWQLQLARDAQHSERWRDAHSYYRDAQPFASDETRRTQLELLMAEFVAQATASLTDAARKAIAEGTEETLRIARRLLEDCVSISPDDETAQTLRTQLVARSDTPDGFVYLPGGRVALGSNRSEDRNATRVETIAAFYLATREITVAEYRHFIEANGYETRDWWSEAGWNFIHTLPSDQRRPLNWAEQTHPNRPVTGVSAFEAQAYAAWRSHTENAAYRLPTDSEWELGARHGPTDRLSIGRLYPWGNEWAEGGLDTIRDIQPVGSNPRDKSQFGCLDMAGNVAEWIVRPQTLTHSAAADSAAESSAGDSADDSERADDEAGDVPAPVVLPDEFGIRGAAATMRPAVRERFARTAKRGFADPATRSPQIGFRLARSLAPN